MAIHRIIKIGYDGISTSTGIALGGKDIYIGATNIYGIWWNVIMLPFWNDIMTYYWDVPMDEEI